MARVFAYGSNLHLPHLRAWAAEKGHPAPGELCLAPACLPEHHLVWNYRSPKRKAGAANVEPCPGRCLPGGVLTLADADLALIDAKEGHPHRYQRSLQTVRLLEDDSTVEAWVYVVTPEWILPAPQWPRLDYLVTILEGARALGLPGEHLRELGRTPHQDPEADYVVRVTGKAGDGDGDVDGVELEYGGGVVARWRAGAAEPELLPGHEALGAGVCREALGARRALAALALATSP